MKFQYKLTAAAVGAAALFASVSASATETFAVYNPVPSKGGAAPVPNVMLKGTNSSGTLTEADPSIVSFTYLDGAALIALGDLKGILKMSATETPFGVAGVPLAYFDGYLSITYDGPTKTVGGITLTKGVTNLLTDTFTSALFTAAGSAATLADSDFTGTTVFSSDLLTFDNSVDENFTLGITSATPPLSFYKSGYLKSFAGVSNGNFAATVTGTCGGGGVPEPASWALMILGFAGVGVAMRGRSKALSAAA